MKSQLERFLQGEKEYSIRKGISGVLVPFKLGHILMNKKKYKGR